MTQDSENRREEGITIFGRKPSEVLAAFHASGLSARGFAIAGRIVPQTARIAGADGENSHLFDGEHLYAGTFMRTGPTT